MNALQEILIFIIDTFATLFLVLVVLRFFLQLARADYYNPISQAIVKITSPALVPLRRIIPGIFGIDIASIILALVVHVAAAELIYLVLTGGVMNPMILALWAALGTLKMTTYICFVGMFILFISSFVAPYSTHPGLLLVRQLMEPALAPIRRFVPPVGGLDLSLMFFGMALVIIQILLDSAAGSVGLIDHNARLIIGF